MSAAHRAFWLPLAQQSDTANDLEVFMGILQCKRLWDNIASQEIDRFKSFWNVQYGRFFLKRLIFALFDRA